MLLAIVGIEGAKPTSKTRCLSINTISTLRKWAWPRESASKRPDLVLYDLREIWRKRIRDMVDRRSHQGSSLISHPSSNVHSLR